MIRRRNPGRAPWRLVVMLPLALVAASPSHAQPTTGSEAELRRALDRILSEAGLENALWGVAVHDLTRDRSVYAHDDRVNHVPASNTKLYTTATALHLLGPDFRYRTDLFAAGPVVDGVLHGPLVVRGSGDPVLGPRFSGDATLVFRQWADSLRAHGIRVVDGDIIGDDDIFDDQALGYGWSWDDEPFWYSAEVSGLSYHDNTVDFAAVGTSAGAPARLSWEPASTTYMQVLNATVTTATGRVVESWERGRSDNRLRVASSVPEGGVDDESISVSNPTAYFVHVLRETLLGSGIAVRGAPRDVDELPIRPQYDGPGLVRVARHESEPLSNVVYVLNKRSQNLYAELVLKSVGAYAGERPVTGSSAALSWRTARPVLAEAGIDTLSVQLVDGSGLSRQNLVSARATLALLRFMWNHPSEAVRDAFLFSLPVGGIDGTLASRYPGGRARGNVRAKTGTVSNASALSGYVRTDGGSTFAFSIMANHFTVPASRIREIQDRLVETLALHRR
jgi:D-alanyl-D-alanine carboxypeptidase/D-alanyl-D-alanine-endopeptidase (penicillin-binding protein 4)